LTRRPGGGDAVVTELAAELVEAPLDLDVLAALVAIALMARWSPNSCRSTSTCSPRWSPSRWWPRSPSRWWPHRSTSTCSPR
jgi:hypothetical protein